MSESRVTYEYDGTGRLASAAYLDGTVVRYSGEAVAPARASAGAAVFCTQCGTKLAPDAAFCTTCGARVE
jgi:uncharacterized OB-fold protein